MRIDRCVCADRTFCSLRRQMERDGLSLEQLAQVSGATRGCGMCLPYLERALRTGQVVFHEIIPPASEPDAA